MTCGSCAALADHDAICRVLYRFARSLDVGDFNSYANCFTDDATLAFAGGSPITGREAIRRSVAADLGRYAGTQHLVTNIESEVDGSSAVVRSYFLATHLLDPHVIGSHWDGGGRYESEFVERGGQWRIAVHRPALLWTSGDAPARVGPDPQ